MIPPRRTPSLLPLLLLLPGLLPAQESRRITERSSALQVVEPDAAERELRMTPVVRAVQRAADSVVSIYLQNQQLLANHQPATEGQGSGVILDESGLVITNWHVVWPIVERSRELPDLSAVVRLRDGRMAPAAVISHSKTHDLALLQMQLNGDEKVRPIEIGRSATLMIGETLIAIGNPQGHANTVTTGVLSATGRTIRVRAPDGVVRDYADLIQTDAAINEGNSGGALLDITGRLVGINNAMAKGAENIGFAIPMDLVREVFETELTQSSSFAVTLDAPWLGIEVRQRGENIVVASVLVDSPASKAGIEPGDILLAARGQPITSSLDYQRMLVSAPVGQPFALAVRRGDREQERAPVPCTFTDWLLLRALGCEFEEVTLEQAPELLRQVTLEFYGAGRSRAVAAFPSTLRVRTVAPGSPAAGVLQPGDVVFACVVRSFLNEVDVPLTTRRELHERIGTGRTRAIKLAFLRDGKDFYTTLEVRPITER